MSKSPEYLAWLNLRSRCEPDHERAKDYFQRGIRVCERWQNSFEAFYEDMGPRPSDRHSIDRINNDGNYEPGNCRWATAREQGLNARHSERPRNPRTGQWMPE